MEKLSGNHSDSGVIDGLMLDKCVWVLKLETCCSIYAVVIFVTHVIGFVLTFVLTLRCCKEILRLQIAMMQQEEQQRARASQQPPIGSAEGDQGAAVVEHGNVDQGGQHNQDDRRRSSRRLSTVHTQFESVKLSNPNTIGMLTYDLLMAVVGALTQISIINKNEELFKMCISILTFGNVIFLAITLAGALDRCILRKAGSSLCNLILFGIVFYATLVLWSYAKVLHHLKD